jgi:GDP-4-dehydro-6-deoxy-D-mannose reductase
MKVGVLTTARDFIDVRDGVEGMMLLLEAGRPGQPVNICTGTAYKISEILEMLIEISGLKVSVETDPSLMRPSDETLLLGDNTKLRALGWRQKYTMRQTLTAVYEDWLSRI